MAAFGGGPPVWHSWLPCRRGKTASGPCDGSEATQSWPRCPGRSPGARRDFNDDVPDELGARTPSSPGTTRRQASLSTDRGRSARRTRRKCRRSPRPVSSMLARCDPTRVRVTRQCRCRSSGSPPQRCHRRSASRSSPRCQARDALRAPPNVGGHGPDALPAEHEPPRGRDRRRPPPLPYPQGRCGGPRPTIGRAVHHQSGVTRRYRSGIGWAWQSVTSIRLLSREAGQVNFHLKDGWREPEYADAPESLDTAGRAGRGDAHQARKPPWWTQAG